MKYNTIDFNISNKKRDKKLKRLTSFCLFGFSRKMVL